MSNEVARGSDCLRKRTRQSYTTTNRPISTILRDGLSQWRLVRGRIRNIDQICRQSIEDMRHFAVIMDRACGRPVRGMRILEIGHGQAQIAIAYMATQGNQCSGIDLDVTPRGLGDLRGYWQLLRANGLIRAAKTAARELSGINRALRQEFCRLMGVQSWPAYDLYTMDACQMGFEEGVFDFVYSTDVFEHLADPRRAMREVLRVLRPDGAFCLRFLHYGHFNALHDLRWITGMRTPPEPWAHLIPSLAKQVHQGAFVNQLFLDDWRRLFGEVCPGHLIELVPVKNISLAQRLASLRQQHPELMDHPEEELLTDYVCALGRKSAEQPPAIPPDSDARKVRQR